MDQNACFWLLWASAAGSDVFLASSAATHAARGGGTASLPPGKKDVSNKSTVGQVAAGVMAKHGNESMQAQNKERISWKPLQCACWDVLNSRLGWICSSM